jgi:hypothetical protein
VFDFERRVWRSIPKPEVLRGKIGGRWVKDRWFFHSHHGEVYWVFVPATEETYEVPLPAPNARRLYKFDPRYIRITEVRRPAHRYFELRWDGREFQEYDPGLNLGDVAIWNDDYRVFIDSDFCGKRCGKLLPKFWAAPVRLRVLKRR